MKTVNSKIAILIVLLVVLGVGVYTIQKMRAQYNKENINNIVGYEKTLLHDAVIYNNINHAKYLLLKGADPNICFTDNGDILASRPPLFYAKNGEMCKLLISYGASVNFVVNGRTPLIYACRSKRVTVVKELVNNGANVNVGEEIYDTPLLESMHGGSTCEYNKDDEEIALLLLAKGANPNAKDSIGRTPLHYAALAGSYPVVNKLMKGCSNADIRDKYGKRPLDYAVLNGHRHIFGLLR